MIYTKKVTYSQLSRTTLNKLYKYFMAVFHNFSNISQEDFFEQIKLYSFFFSKQISLKVKKSETIFFPLCLKYPLVVYSVMFYTCTRVLLSYTESTVRCIVLLYIIYCILILYTVVDTLYSLCTCTVCSTYCTYYSVYTHNKISAI